VIKAAVFGSFDQNEQKEQFETVPTLGSQRLKVDKSVKTAPFGPF